MTLADFTTPGLIIPHLRGRDAVGVIEELGLAMQREQRVPDVATFREAVLNRERMGSTQIEAGMAFPHARLREVPTLSFALGRSDEAFPWSNHAGSAVHLVFLFAVPENESTRYLLLISGLARLARQEQLLRKIITAQDTFQIFDALHQVSLRKTTAPRHGFL